MVRKVRTRKYGKRKHRRSLKRKSKKTRHFRKRKTLKKQKRIKGGIWPYKKKTNETPDKFFFWSYRKKTDETPDKFFLPSEDVYVGQVVKYKRNGGTDCDIVDFNLIAEGDIIRLNKAWASIDENVIVVNPKHAVGSQDVINLNQICEIRRPVGNRIDPDRIDLSSGRGGYNLKKYGIIRTPQPEILADPAREYDRS